MVGTSKYWEGATVFWQMDYQNRVRTGKIMLYNPATGKRIKEPYNHVTWVHSILHKEDYNLKQCFFGEHLLPEDKSRPVALVESEKTAIIASYYLPNSYGLHRVERTVVSIPTAYPFLPEEALCYSPI